MNKILELLKLFEKFGVKPGKIIGTGDRKITPIKKPILSKTLNRGYLDEDVQAGKISNQTVKNEIEDLAPLFFSKQLNDVEINNAINNLNYLDNLLNPTNIIDITTKQPVKGLESLKAPTSIAGELESAGKNLEKKAEELKGIVDEKPKSIIGDIMKDYGQFQKVMQDEKRKGLVRATARSILYDDIKSGKIKSMTLEDLGSLREPIDPFRKMYGEEALEQLDSLADEFGQMRTAQEAAELAKSRFKLEPSDIKPEGSISIDEAKKAEQEFGINKPKETEVTNITSRIYKDADPDELIVEYNKNNQRLSLTDEEGGTLISYDEFNKLNKRNREIENILESLNVTPVLDDIKPEGIVIPFKKKITEPEEKAEGGIIRAKFAKGGRGKKILDIINEVNKKLKGKKSMETVNPKTGEVTVPDEFITTTEKKLSEPTEKQYYMYDAFDEVDKLAIKHKKAAEAHDELDNIDIYDKIAPDQLADVMAEMEGKNVDKLTDAQRREYYKKAQAYLNDFIKIKRTKTAVDKSNEGLELTATDRLYLKFAQPETKSTYKQGDPITSENFGDTPFAPSQETLDNLKKAREMTKGMSLEEEMNMILNQYDKSMFIKNDQGMVDVTNPENVQKMALLLKRDFPELYRRLEEGMTQTNILDDFDITGRKPNANGGLNYLMGF